MSKHFIMSKHYTSEELLNKFNNLSDDKKVKILTKALSYQKGSVNYRIFRAMGYTYSDSYDTPTYVKTT